MAKALVYVMIFASLVGALTTLVVGVIVQFMFSRPIRRHERAVLKAANRATAHHITGLQQGQITAENARNALSLIGDTVAGLADLAKALKGLDPATRCYSISLVFLVVGITTALLTATIV